MNKEPCLFFLIFTLLSFTLSGEVSAIRKKFIKGNLTEKTQAVKEAGGADAVLLAKAAMQFCTTNIDLLGADRDLDTLAVAAVLSLPASYITSASEEEKKTLLHALYILYTQFSDETLKIAILNKIPLFPLAKLKGDADKDFVTLLNDSLNAQVLSEPLLHSIIVTLGKIGNKISFATLFNYLDNAKYEKYNEEVKAALSSLAVHSEEDIINFIKNGNEEQCKKLYDMCINSGKNSLPFMANVAETTLLRTIYLAEKATPLDTDLLELQTESYNFLVNKKWTKAGESAIKYYKLAYTLYNSKKIDAASFAQVISGLVTIAPLDCPSLLTAYLQEINKAKEGKNASPPSDALIVSVIDALGQVGDKSAFDALLSVTYYDYSPLVIKAARDALTKLKW